MKKSISAVKENGILLWTRRLSAWTLCILLLAASALAAYPEPADVFYVLDKAEVLTEETENSIISRNEALEAETGAQLCVVTVEFTGAERTADYAYGLFNEWGIGSAENNNGILLLLVTGAEDYYLLQGSGLEGYLTSSVLQNILDEYMEPYFAEGEYDDGVWATVNVLFSKFEDYYGIQLTESAEDYSTVQEGSAILSALSGIGVFILRGVFIVVFLAVIVLAILLSCIGRRRRHHGGWGHRPPPPPGGFGGWGVHGHQPPPGNWHRSDMGGHRPGGFGGGRPGGFGGGPGSFGGHGGGFGGHSGGFGGGGHSGGGFGGHSGGGGGSRGGGAGRR